MQAFMRVNSNKKILVCTNFRANPSQPSCGARGSNEVMAELTTAAEPFNISVEAIPCMGLCEAGPNVRFIPNGQHFHAASLNDIEMLIKAFQLLKAC